jgi:hypothetical protein
LNHVLPGLRYGRLWVFLGMLLLVGILVGSLLPGQAVPALGMSDKIKHFLAFALLAFWFGSIVVRGDLPWVAVAAVALGGLIELLQLVMGLGRDAEWLDLLADTIGVAVGLALVLTPLGRWVRWFETRVAPARQ